MLATLQDKCPRLLNASFHPQELLCDLTPCSTPNPVLHCQLYEIEGSCSCLLGDSELILALSISVDGPGSSHDNEENSILVMVARGPRAQDTSRPSEKRLSAQALGSNTL